MESGCVENENDWENSKLKILRLNEEWSLETRNQVVFKSNSNYLRKVRLAETLNAHFHRTRSSSSVCLMS